jgi:DNA-binding response OmpR family regulator
VRVVVVLDEQDLAILRAFDAGADDEVRLRGTLVNLSAKAFALLSTSIEEPTRVFTKAELLRDVWGFQALVPLGGMPPALGG